MATVPFGLACAVYALLVTGVSLNVYSQIGLILVVGIMAKNGILIVEFANQLRDRGLSVRDAIEEASNIRLRPVLMTMIATVLGGVPLVISARRRRRGARSARLGHRRRPRLRRGLDALPDPGRLPAPRPVLQAQGRGSGPPRARARRRRAAISRPSSGGVGGQLRSCPPPPREWSAKSGRSPALMQSAHAQPWSRCAHHRHRIPAFAGTDSRVGWVRDR